MSDYSEVPPSSEVIDHVVGLHDDLHGPALERMNCPCGDSYLVICNPCNCIVFVGFVSERGCEHGRLMLAIRR